jgi:oligopeptide transport system substrate-binding protein
LKKLPRGRWCPRHNSQVSEALRVEPWAPPVNSYLSKYKLKKQFWLYVMTEMDDDGNLVNPDAKLNVTASDDGKTLTVVLPVDVPYFNELAAFPTYMPVKEDVVEGNEAWATVAETYIGNGPYKVVEFSQSHLIMEKNEYYHDAESVVTNKLVFAFNDDDTSTLANFQNGSYLFIDQVPNDEIKSLQEQYPDEFFIEGQLGTYYVSFNVNDENFKAFGEADKAKIRKALGLMIDRNYIVEEIGQAGQVPAAGFVPMGLTEPDGKTEYIAKNGPNGDGAGYYSVDPDDYEKNCEEAVALLREVAESTGLFTVDENGVVSKEFPTIAYLTNEGTGHEAIAINLQATFAQYGINMTIEKQEWATFLNTRKNGDYSVARNGWLGDYNDPISFLDMWITSSGNNDSQFGKGDHAKYAGYTYKGEGGKTWAESYDKIISEVKDGEDNKILLNALAKKDRFVVAPKHLDKDDKAYMGDIVDLAPYMYQDIKVFVNDDDEVVYVTKVEFPAGEIYKKHGYQTHYAHVDQGKAVSHQLCEICY